MRKIVLILTIFVMAGSLNAAQITFTAKDNYDGTCTIGYYTDDPQIQVGPTCIGLLVDIYPPPSAIRAWIYLLDGMDDFFNIFMSAAFKQEFYGIPYEYGEYGLGPTTYHPNYTGNNDFWIRWPIALSEGSPNGLHFGISLCGLGGDSDAPVLEDSPISTDSANPIVVAVLHCLLDTDGTISLNEIVGGVVDKNGTMTTNLDNDITIGFTISQSPPGPQCWNWAGHCKGNATDVSGGTGYVNLDDFYVFRGSFLKNYRDHWNDGAGPYTPCADFDSNGNINLDDFILFRNNFLTTTTGCVPAAWPPVTP